MHIYIYIYMYTVGPGGAHRRVPIPPKSLERPPPTPSPPTKSFPTKSP